MNLRSALTFRTVFVALLLLASCANLPPVNWPQAVACTEHAGQDLVGVVTQTLYSGGDVKDELEKLGREYAPGVVACIVEQLVHDMTSPGAAQVPERVAAAARGRAFLDAVGTVATLPESSGGEW